jgi:hypothetical protein
MFEIWGYLVWLILAIRLFAYARWLWGRNYRLGSVGAVFLIVAALGLLIYGSFSGSGLE